MKALITDAGHGGQDSGALNGTTGDREKDLALDFTQRFNIHYEALTGRAPFTTRENDIFITLTGRAKLANSLGAALLSFHLNASNKKGKGVEAFTSRGQTKSDPWATALLEAFVMENPDIAERFDLSDGDPDKEASFTVLSKTKNEAVLFELGFIDNPHDIKYLGDQEWRERNAYVLAYATAKYFGDLQKGLREYLPTVEENPRETKKSEWCRERDIDWQIHKLKQLFDPASPLARREFNDRLRSIKYLAMQKP